MVAAQVCQSQLVGRSEDSLIGVPVHSSRVGVVPVSSEDPSSILDVSAGAVVSISSATSMVGQGSKVNRDSVSPLVSFAQPIVSSVVSVDELDDSPTKFGFSGPKSRSSRNGGDSNGGNQRPSTKGLLQPGLILTKASGNDKGKVVAGDQPEMVLSEKDKIGGNSKFEFG
ncbi:hypothetical protein LWI29_037894 [Acer saccharum]|uniref:Uncharacterized protein n=1 Tax=Acer saccharum TaxID=4024 RepID=A0AA39VUE3_ACESA|nr:hypothetical protein LWI29_037894 [Acer saccharum]